MFNRIWRNHLEEEHIRVGLSREDTYLLMKVD